MCFDRVGRRAPWSFTTEGAEALPDSFISHTSLFGYGEIGSLFGTWRAEPEGPAAGLSTSLCLSLSTSSRGD